MLGAALAPAQSWCFENWLAQRDAGVVRQSLDYSCGIAALATLLTHYYADPVSELELLQQLLQRDRALASSRNAGVSFADLAWLARQRGYAAVGLSLGAADFSRLRRPVIVRLQNQGDTHFSVVRGVDASGSVQLADPSWGRVRLSSWQFRRAMGEAVSASPVLVLDAGEEGAETADYFRRRIQAVVRMPGALGD